MCTSAPIRTLVFGLCFLALLIPGTSAPRPRSLSSNLFQNNISTLAGSGTAGFDGDGGSATLAQLNGPQAVAVDGMGDIFIADTQNSVIREIAPSGNPITSVAGFFNATAMVADFEGNLFMADPGDNIVIELNSTGIFAVAGNFTGGFAGDGGQAISASLNQPTGVALDYAGNLYIADSG